MDDQNGSLSRVGSEAGDAAKGVDALTASLQKLASAAPEATSPGEKAFQQSSGAAPASRGNGGEDKGSNSAKAAEKDAAALEKAQAKIDEAAAKTAMQRLKLKQKNELKAIEGHEATITKLKNVHQKERFALVKEAAEGTLSTVSSNLQTLAEKNKAFGGAAKAAMMADATMKTYNSAVGAWDQAMNLPRPFGLVMAPISAALAVGAGMVNVSKIAGQKFEQGGAVFGPSHAMGGVMAELEGGEYVVPRKTVSQIGGFQAVEGTLQTASRSRVSSTINVTVNGKSGSGSVMAGSGSPGKSLIASMRGHQNKSRIAGAYRITG